MKYKVVLFDADGVTLLDEGYFSEHAAKQGLLVSQEVTEPFFEKVFPKCLIGDADLKEELSKVIDDWGWRGSVEELTEFWFSVGDDVNKDVEGFIKKLKERRVQCFLAADQERYRGEYLRKKLRYLIEDFFFSGEIWFTKKEPEFFDYVYDKIKDKVRNKSDILFIDDMEHNVNNAREFGIEAIHFRTVSDLP